MSPSVGRSVHWSVRNAYVTAVRDEPANDLFRVYELVSEYPDCLKLEKRRKFPWRLSDERCDSKNLLPNLLRRLLKQRAHIDNNVSINESSAAFVQLIHDCSLKVH